LDFERERVHAVAQPRRARAVREDVAQVRVAGRAAGLDPAHAVARVDLLLDRALRRGREEARPPGARLELRLAREQLGAAGGAAVDAVAVRRQQLAAPGRLGRAAAEHVVALRRELPAPLLFGLTDALDHLPCGTG